MKLYFYLLAAALVFSNAVNWAGTVTVGGGSYTDTFPGVDAAARNGFPPGTPQLSGNAVGRPVPTNDWWSALLNTNHAGNLFNYPLAMGTLTYGLDIGQVSGEPRDPFDTVVVGVSGLAATRATVDDYSDWTVTIAWESVDHSFRATTGIGMPFVYFSKAPDDVASITVSEGTATIDGEILLITDSEDGANFAVYAPADSVWTKDGNTYTSDFDKKTYWTMALLPAGDPATVAADWQQYAYVEPVNTEVTWSYDESSAILRTEFITTVNVHEEGAGTTVIQGLLPHQWAHLAPDAPALTGAVGVKRPNQTIITATRPAPQQIRHLTKVVLHDTQKVTTKISRNGSNEDNPPAPPAAWAYAGLIIISQKLLLPARHQKRFRRVDQTV